MSPLGRAKAVADAWERTWTGPRDWPESREVLIKLIEAALSEVPAPAPRKCPACSGDMHYDIGRDLYEHYYSSQCPMRELEDRIKALELRMSTHG